MCNRIKISARKDKQGWIEKKCNQIEKCTMEEKTMEAYKFVKEVNRKWQPKQTAIKDTDGNIKMDKDKCKQRWTQYYNDQSDDNRKHIELETISPPAIDDTENDILY